MTSTLATLFAPGQKVYELDDDDLGELIDIVLETLKDRRGEDLEILPVAFRDNLRATMRTAADAAERWHEGSRDGKTDLRHSLRKLFALVDAPDEATVGVS